MADGQWQYARDSHWTSNPGQAKIFELKHDIDADVKKIIEENKLDDKNVKLIVPHDYETFVKQEIDYQITNAIQHVLNEGYAMEEIAEAFVDKDNYIVIFTNDGEEFAAGDTYKFRVDIADSFRLIPEEHDDKEFYREGADIAEQGKLINHVAHYTKFRNMAFTESTKLCKNGEYPERAIILDHENGHVKNRIIVPSLEIARMLPHYKDSKMKVVEWGADVRSQAYGYRQNYDKIWRKLVKQDHIEANKALGKVPAKDKALAM